MKEQVATARAIDKYSWVVVKEAATPSDVTVDTIGHWIRRKKIPVRVRRGSGLGGVKYYVRIADVIAYRDGGPAQAMLDVDVEQSPIDNTAQKKRQAR